MAPVSTGIQMPLIADAALLGADTAFRDLLAEDAVAYAGYSAGPCVLSPSLRGLEAVDDADAVVRIYGSEPVWDGLALLDEAFVPHCQSPGIPRPRRSASLPADTGPRESPIAPCGTGKHSLSAARNSPSCSRPIGVPHVPITGIHAQTHIGTTEWSIWAPPPTSTEQPLVVPARSASCWSAGGKLHGGT